MNFNTIFEFFGVGQPERDGRSRPPIEDDMDIHKIDF